jgi:diacylglycerol kinase family enzyme
VDGIDLAFANKVACRYETPALEKSEEKIYVEADGELLGTLPAEITIIPDALTLLAPKR